MKRYRKYGRNVGWIVNWSEKYGRKVMYSEKLGKYGRKGSWIVKRYENTQERKFE